MNRTVKRRLALLFCLVLYLSMLMLPIRAEDTPHYEAELLESLDMPNSPGGDISEGEYSIREDTQVLPVAFNEALAGIQSNMEAEGYQTRNIDAEKEQALDVTLDGVYGIHVEVPAGAFDADVFFFARTVSWGDLRAEQTEALAIEGVTPETEPVLFDIGFMGLNDELEAEEIEPGLAVLLTISVETPAQSEAELRMEVYHVDETGGEPVVDVVASSDVDSAGEVVVEDGKAVATIETGSFSIYALKYTVDFYMGEYEFHLDGGGSMPLSELMDALGMEADAADVAAVDFDGPDGLLEISNGGGEWRITSLGSFTEWYRMTITMSSGDSYTIDMTDATYNNVIAAITDTATNGLPIYANWDSTTKTMTFFQGSASCSTNKKISDVLHNNTEVEKVVFLPSSGKFKLA